MTGAASTSAGCVVHEIGTWPRFGSDHFSGIRCWFSCMLSPSLMKMATYAFVGSSVGGGGGGGGVIVRGTPPKTVRLRDQSAAKTGTRYCAEAPTPDGSLTHQPR